MGTAAVPVLLTCDFLHITRHENLQVPGRVKGLYQGMNLIAVEIQIYNAVAHALFRIFHVFLLKKRPFGFPRVFSVFDKYSDQTKQLYCFSCPMVVEPPCPGRTSVSSGRAKSLSFTLCTRSDIDPVGMSVRPTLSSKSVSPANRTG